MIGLLADRIPLRRALILNFVCMTAGSLMLLASDVRTLLPVFLVVHGFTVAAENVLIPLVIARAFGVRYMARIYGVLMLSLPIGGVLGPIFAGFVFDRSGDYGLAFGSFAVLNVFALMGLFFLRRETLADGFDSNAG